MKKNLITFLIVANLFASQTITYATNPANSENSSQLSRIQEDRGKSNQFLNLEIKQAFNLSKQKLQELKISVPEKIVDIDSTIKLIDTCSEEINYQVSDIKTMFEKIKPVNKLDFNKNIQTIYEVENILREYTANIEEYFKSALPNDSQKEVYEKDVQIVEKTLKMKSERYKLILNRVEKKFNDLNEKIKNQELQIKEIQKTVIGALLCVSNMYDFFYQSISNIPIGSDSDKFIKITVDNPSKENIEKLMQIYNDEQTSLVDKMNIYRNISLLSNRGNKFAFIFLQIINKSPVPRCPNELFLDFKDLSCEVHNNILSQNQKLDEEYANFLISFFNLKTPLVKSKILGISEKFSDDLNSHYQYRVDLLAKRDFKNYDCWFVSPKACPQRGGWKLHISAQPKSAKNIARLVLPYIINKNLSAKICLSLPFLRLFTMKSCVQCGKFIVIYTNNNDEARVVTNALHNIISNALKTGLLSPYDFCECIGDIKIGDTGALYARCGAYYNSSQSDDFFDFDNRWNPIPFSNQIEDVAKKRIIAKTFFKKEIEKLKEGKLNELLAKNEIDKLMLFIQNTPDNGFDRTFPFDLDVSFLGLKMKKTNNIFETYENILKELDTKRKYFPEILN